MWSDNIISVHCKQHALTSRAGLVAVGELIRQLKLPALIDRLLPKAGRSRAYATSDLFNTFMLMLHNGAEPGMTINPLISSPTCFHSCCCQRWTRQSCSAVSSSTRPLPPIWLRTAGMIIALCGFTINGAKRRKIGSMH